MNRQVHFHAAPHTTAYAQAGVVYACPILEGCTQMPKYWMLVQGGDHTHYVVCGSPEACRLNGTLVNTAPPRPNPATCLHEEVDLTWVPRKTQPGVAYAKLTCSVCGSTSFATNWGPRPVQP